jgi:hypothetical protein
MQKVVLLSVLMLFAQFFLSCGNRSSLVHTVDFNKDSVVEKAVLKELIVEIFLIEASIYKTQIDGRDIQYYSNSYYDWFFRKHNINRRRILKSIEYYTSRKEMDAIMQDVVSTMMEIELKAAQEKGVSNEKIELPDQQTPAWIEQITEN